MFQTLPRFGLSIINYTYNSYVTSYNGDHDANQAHTGHSAILVKFNVPTVYITVLYVQDLAKRFKSEGRENAYSK